MRPTSWGIFTMWAIALVGFASSLFSASLQAQDEGAESPFHCQVQATPFREGASWGLRIEGSTDLPTDTQLLISLMFCDEVVENSWGRVFVKGPTFRCTLGQYERPPLAGTYRVRISCDLERQDPGPYMALQDVGSLEFYGDAQIGTPEEDLAQDRAFMEWFAASLSALRTHQDDLQKMFARAAEKKEFRTSDDSFDAFSCVRWVDQWVAQVERINTGAAPFRDNVFAPRYPVWLRQMSEAVSGVIMRGVASAADCFQANGVPPPSRYEMKGGVRVEGSTAPTDFLAPYQDVVTQLTARVAEKEKALREKREGK